MTNGDVSVDLVALRDFYAADATAKRILDSLSGRKNFKKITTVDYFVDRLGLYRAQVVAFYKRLTVLGCGEFWLGRREHPSRFEWYFPLGNVARAASGSATTVGEPVDGEADEEDENKPEDDQAVDDPSLMTVRFPLRRGQELLFRVPVDLSDAEAERLATFIRSLPFR